MQKRKIPRRRYKVRKKSLESRLSVLSKDLTDLKEELRKASSRYANTMRQIEVAETELEETEVAIRRIEVRYRRREISKETYRKPIVPRRHLSLSTYPRQFSNHFSPGMVSSSKMHTYLDSRQAAKAKRGIMPKL